jgi:hypothetical protein
MENLFGLLILTSFIFFIIGIFKPTTSLFWDKEKVTRKKSAFVYGGLTLLFFILFGVTTDRKPTFKNTQAKQTETRNSNSVVVKEQQPQIKRTTIEKLKNKRESRNDGEYNEMTLFFVDSSITLNELEDFCREEKSNYSNGYFQILVFFKDKKAARFPDNPITATFIEESDLTKIKAIYTINNFNSYSKLDYYEQNAYTSSSQSVDIK